MSDSVSKSIQPFVLNLSEQIELLQKEKSLTFVNLGNIPSRAFVVSEIFRQGKFQNIFWASSDEKADELSSAAKTFFSGEISLIPKIVTMADVYKVQKKMKEKDPSLFLFESLSEFLQKPIPTHEDIESEKIEIKKGEKLEIFRLFDVLEKKGYTSAEDDEFLQPGEFVRKGENLFIFPENEPTCFRIILWGDEVEKIENFFPESQKNLAENKSQDYEKLEIYPKVFQKKITGTFFSLLENQTHSLFISDDLDESITPNANTFKIKFTTFPQEEERFFHLNFFSVLPFYMIGDFVLDLKERLRREFDIVIMTKKKEEVIKILRENEIMLTENMQERAPSTVRVCEVSEDGFLPNSFQCNDRKFFFLTDREIFKFHRASRTSKAISGLNIDLMRGLKSGDYVIHADHGLAQFEGIVRKDLGKDLGTREYLKLCYAENDQLFVPVESAERITKFVGDSVPKLTRLGSSEWQSTKNKLKEETQRIAKDLLKLYAKRELAKGISFHEDDEMLKDFCDTFHYELTPGQAQAWFDVRRDMESEKPMDRLVCGDVGFGKTEIAMRAAFKCFRNGMQAAMLAPITILAEQHYQGFIQRIQGKNYGVRVALLSRFQSAAEQKKIVSDIEHGLVDIVIGTHRLLSDDIKFKNLGLLMIDEEQRFGVKQKEKLKSLRAAIDILIMTATPIPRTLNMGLNKLKDISTITTPPPGRLPVITEVRKYNLNLIRDRILHELERDGQVYFLHNEVRTIEAQAQQLRALIPEASFIVAHGQLSPTELEDRIRAFKNKEARVLIASTIIENGIDLPDANTLLVNRAEKFGLSQLYQLRGRVGRRRIQAYAFFLYHGQKLELESKKRLRAIVEASELGAGFQISMRDLEIRGAGEILGVNQSGTIKTVGVSHFIQMLNKTIEEMKTGSISTEIKEEETITVEIPVSAFIPPTYIPSSDEKIQIYKELSSAATEEDLNDLRSDLKEDYGKLPQEVENLFQVLKLKMLLRKANLEGIKVYRHSHQKMEVTLRMGKSFTPDQIFGLVKTSSRPWKITATALKLEIPHLPVAWFEEFSVEIKKLIPEKKDKV